MEAEGQAVTQQKIERAFWYVLGGLLVVAVLSVIGYGTFGRHPQWLSAFPAPISKYLNDFYQISFRLFGEGQTWLMFLALAAYLTWKVKGKWVLPLVVVFGLSFGSEILGTLYGFPFGDYFYSETLLGYRLFGHVPLVIPFSWFMMAVPSFAIAYAAFPKSRTKVVLMGALLLTQWDVSLDPAMSYLVPYWSWKVKGGFYGMPLQNWLGWYLTSVVLMAAMVGLRSERWIEPLSMNWMRGFYVLNLFVPFGMLLVAGLWWGVLVSLVCFTVCFVGLMPPAMRLHLWFSTSPTPSPSPGVVEQQLP